MTLYVKGNIDIGGGATFSVAKGSSLKIVPGGRFNLPSALNVASDSPTDDEGNPILSIYSTYNDGGASGESAGVTISGGSTLKGTIFAPYSTVSVSQGGGGVWRGERQACRGVRRRRYSLRRGVDGIERGHRWRECRGEGRGRDRFHLAVNADAMHAVLLCPTEKPIMEADPSGR